MDPTLRQGMVLRCTRVVKIRGSTRLDYPGASRGAREARAGVSVGESSRSAVQPAATRVQRMAYCRSAMPMELSL